MQSYLGQKEVHGRKKKKDVMEFNKKANQKTIRIQYLEWAQSSTSITTLLYIPKSFVKT